MTDIIERLRGEHVCEGYTCLWDDVMRKAADEIELLRMERKSWQLAYEAACGIKRGVDEQLPRTP